MPEMNCAGLLSLLERCYNMNRIIKLFGSYYRLTICFPVKLYKLNETESRIVCALRDKITEVTCESFYRFGIRKKKL